MEAVKEFVSKLPDIVSTKVIGIAVIFAGVVVAIYYYTFVAGIKPSSIKSSSGSRVGVSSSSSSSTETKGRGGGGKKGVLPPADPSYGSLISPDGKKSARLRDRKTPGKAE